MKMNPRNLNIDRYHYAFTKLEELGRLLPSRKVYDVGSGDGRMQQIEKLGLQWFGFDKTGWGEVLAWDMSESCPMPSEAGAILLLDVIEHIPNPSLSLQNLAAAMLPNTRLIITTPNPRWSGCCVNMMLGGYASSFSAYDLIENHQVLPI
jgi:SAM-dependent methyltransferase